MNGGRIDKILAVPYYYQLEQLLQEKIERTPRSGGDTFQASCFFFRQNR